MARTSERYFSDPDRLATLDGPRAVNPRSKVGVVARKVGVAFENFAHKKHGLAPLTKAPARGKDYIL